LSCCCHQAEPFFGDDRTDQHLKFYDVKTSKLDFDLEHTKQTKQTNKQTNQPTNQPTKNDDFPRPN